MASTETARAATYILPRGDPPGLPAPGGRASPGAALPDAFLVANALWFCRLRWAVIGLLAAFGLAQWWFPGLWGRTELGAYTLWPFAVAGALFAANLAFLAHARRISRRATALAATSNLWAQIVVDLLLLTVVVHCVGSLETFIPFAYLVHIVLACIFFSRPESLVATAFACIAYIACVAAECLRIVGPGGIHSDPALRTALEAHTGLIVLRVGSAVAIWLIVWFLASRLSSLIRDRDRALTATNERLRLAHEEKAKHMLRTTHELKAPFAAIHANADLLLKGYCGELPDEARAVVERIATRSQRLAIEIHEMLNLAKLRSASAIPLQKTRVRLDAVLEWCVAQVQAAAHQRNVTTQIDLAPIVIWAVEEHLQLLFSNLVSNAVSYSNAGGQVEVTCHQSPDEGPLVRITDHGIGIPEDKLPHIFDEYYRTDEAARHNKNSTGLGLAIVRHIAERHGIDVHVQSTPGESTTFELYFPRD